MVNRGLCARCWVEGLVGRCRREQRRTEVAAQRGCHIRTCANSTHPQRDLTFFLRLIYCRKDRVLRYIIMQALWYPKSNQRPLKLLKDDAMPANSTLCTLRVRTATGCLVKLHQVIQATDLEELLRSVSPSTFFRRLDIAQGLQLLHSLPNGGVYHLER